MVEFTVNFATLKCQWGFKNTFISLPVPGDKHFSALYKNLLPYGIALTTVTFEKDTRYLADERLVIPLLDGRLKLRLAYAGFDFSFSNLFDDDGFSLADFGQALFPALKEMGADVEQGVALFTYQGFIHLGEVAPDDFIRQHLSGNRNMLLTPVAFNYQIGPTNAPPFNSTVRLHVSRSFAPNFPTELYVELTAEYLAPGEITKFAEHVNRDWHLALGSIDLILSTMRGVDNASK